MNSFQSKPMTVWYTEGYQACMNGVSNICCPYKLYSYGYAEWQRGYYDASQQCIDNCIS